MIGKNRFGLLPQMPTTAGAGLDQRRELGTQSRFPASATMTHEPELSPALSQRQYLQNARLEAEKPRLGSSSLAMGSIS